MQKFSIATFTGEKNDPSSRYRIRQYTQFLESEGIEVSDYYSRAGKYPPHNRKKRVKWLFSTLMERYKQVNNLSKGDYKCVVLQREMISTLKTFEGMINLPIIFDVDDAIHLGKRGSNIIDIAKKSTAIICGNKYLADYYSLYCSNVYILPTPVNVELYKPRIDSKDNCKITVGWIGTSGNFKYLKKIENALKVVLDQNLNAELLIVSNEKPNLDNISEFNYLEWSEKSEIQDLQKIDIGIMPLENDEWSKGKCSFKMLQYMACGIPVVVSPVGMNLEVLNKGIIGYGPNDYYQGWIDSLEDLIKDENLRKKLGQNGREVVVDYYSTEQTALKLIEIIKKISINN